MNPAEIIARKRDGHELTDEQLEFFVNGFADGSIPDYQMSALAMAIFLQGMQPEEIAALTKHMLRSGAVLQWSGDTPKVDKHSTGGIGDKVSIVLAPLLACAGLQVPMISGRGLGPTGGTLDKLESIPGFRTDLPLDEMQRITREVGCVINGATAELAPADKKLYALRDVTGTVPSIPLITGSIMSKKLAEGLDALVLDVKCGSGAFMKTEQDARTLADSLVRVGAAMGLKISAILTDMNQPLGRMVGNAVEIDESVAALQGNEPDDMMAVTLALGGELLALTGKAGSREDGESILQSHVDSGAGLEKLAEMVAAQGGNLQAAREVAPASDVGSPATGVVQAWNAHELGMTVIEMGGGRRVKTDRLDHAVGFETLVRIGDQVTAGQPIARLFARDNHREMAAKMIQNAITIGDSPCPAPPLIL